MHKYSHKRKELLASRNSLQIRKILRNNYTLSKQITGNFIIMQTYFLAKNYLCIIYCASLLEY